MTDGTVYAVASGKGGVGKTTTAVNLGAGFARAGRSVVVVDLDLGMANLSDFVESSPAGPTLHEVLAEEATLDDALSHASPNLDVIRGSDDLELFGRADPRGIRTLLSDLRGRYDVVILDSGGGLSHDTALPLGLADSIILVSTVEKPAVKNTAKTLQLAGMLEGSLEGIVLTRVGGGKEEVDPTDVASSLDLQLLGSVPEDSTVKASAAAGEPLLEYDEDSPAAQAYLEIAYDLLGETLPMGFGDRGATVESVEQVAQSAEPEPSGDPAVEPVEGAEGSESAGDDGPADAEEPEAEAATEAQDSEAEAEAETGEASDASEDEDEDGVAFEPEPEEVDPSTDVDGEADESEVEGEGQLIEEPTDSDDAEEESRSFLSKITGGLLG